MSLTIAMRNALSGLTLNQFGLSVVANNISNANTDGYTRKMVQQVSRSANGIGSGVDIAGVARSVNDSLIRELRTQMSRLGIASVKSDYFASMQNSFGTPGATNAVNANIGRLGAAFEALGSAPQNAQNQLDTITSATTMARQINDMANSTQNLRAQADQDISAAVTRINQLAQRIQDLNDQIVRGSGMTGQQSTTDLQDSRDTAVRELSELVDVSTYNRADGRMMVVIAGGYNLVSDAASPISYTAAAAVSPATTFNAITLGGSGDLTSKIRGGKLKSLIDMRDVTLQNYMAQLDKMAATLRDKVNAAHNNGSAVPAPNSLTGTQTTAGATVFPASTGSVRIAVTDGTGAVVKVVDYALPAVATTVGAVVTALNTALGPEATCVLNSSGQMVIQAAAGGNGVSINQNTGLVGASGQGFSQYFGLNDFFVGSDNAGLNGDLALSIGVNPTLTANPGQISRATLSLTAVAGQAGLAPGDGSAAQALANVFTSQYAFAATGGLPSMTCSIADFSAAIIAANANLAANAKNDQDIASSSRVNIESRISSQSGVSVDEEMANMVVLQNAYNASAQVIRAVNSMFDQLEQILH